MNSTEPCTYRLSVKGIAIDETVDLIVGMVIQKQRPRP